MKSIHHHFHSPRLGLFLIRLIAGAIFLAHGIMKLSDMNMTIGYFGTLGLGAFLAWAVAILETLGGAAFILGVFTKFFGAVLSIIMIVAILKVSMAMGFIASETPLLLLAVSVSVLFSGCGRYSVCGWNHKNCEECKDGKCDCEHGMK